MPYRGRTAPFALRIAGVATLFLLIAACSQGSERAKPSDVEKDAVDFGAKAPPPPQDSEDSEARYD